MFPQPRNPRLAEEHEKARQLRYLGASVKRIARHLGVSQSSVSVWVRDIELSPQQHRANLRRAGRVRGEAWRDRHRAERRAFQEEGRQRARLEEALHVAGCMLYWAEGAKNRNTARLANSDPAMMTMFTRFLRECLGIPTDDLAFYLNVYTNNGRTIGEIEAYWLKLLGLPPESARRHTVNHFPSSSSGRKLNKLPNGVCCLSVKRSTWLVQHIYGAIQEYSGIDQPTWLDGPTSKPSPESGADGSPQPG